MELHHIRQVACLAVQAGGRALAAHRQQFTISEKGRFDLVTDADHASQAAVKEVLLSHFPEHEFLGEESEDADKFRGTDDPVWVTDPLDGTTNYIHDFPAFCVSTGLWMNGQVMAGAIYDPTRDELFSTARTQGAFIQEQPIRCSRNQSLEQSLLAVGFPANIRGKEEVVDAWKHFGYVTQGLRRSGSAALNLAYVACGRLDAFFAYQIAPWDLAAGILLVEEAGGKVTNFRGEPYDLFSHTALVASNGKIHGEVLERLATMNR